MTVEAPKRTWTDERLDELNKKVDDGFAKADKKMDDGFAKVDATFREVRGEMKAGFDKVDAKVDTDIRELRGDMKGLRKELLAATIVIIGVLIKSHGL
jgi:hypothetical protein